MGVLLVTLVSGSLQAMGRESVDFGGMAGPSAAYPVRFSIYSDSAERFSVITSVYLVMPVGQLSLRHALIGGVTAAVLWEITRHVLVWYFATLSQIGAGLRIADDGNRGIAEP